MCAGGDRWRAPKSRSWLLSVLLVDSGRCCPSHIQSWVRSPEFTLAIGFARSGGGRHGSWRGAVGAAIRRLLNVAVEQSEMSGNKNPAGGHSGRRRPKEFGACLNWSGRGTPIESHGCSPRQKKENEKMNVAVSKRRCIETECWRRRNIAVTAKCRSAKCHQAKYG